jgi:hypothetical protein
MPAQIARWFAALLILAVSTAGTAEVRVAIVSLRALAHGG